MDDRALVVVCGRVKFDDRARELGSAIDKECTGAGVEGCGLSARRIALVGNAVCIAVGLTDVRPPVLIAVRALDEEFVQDLTGGLGPLPPMKIHCGQLVEGALKNALDLGQVEGPDGKKALVLRGPPSIA